MQIFKLLVFIFLVSFFSKDSWAFENTSFLKGGIGGSLIDIGTRRTEHKHAAAFSFHTQFGYRFKDFEFATSSYVAVGSIKNLPLEANGEELLGDGSMQHISFEILPKYISNLQIRPGWFWYFGAGPTISIQTIRLFKYSLAEDDENGNDEAKYDKKYKIIYHSKGIAAVMGFEQKLLTKMVHPTYFEFYYSYNEASKVVVVDPSDFFKNVILSSSDTRQRIKGHVFLLSMGLTIF